MLSKSPSAARTASTRLSRSNNCFQSTSEIRRKLVMMLRTETFAAPCWRWTSRTAVVGRRVLDRQTLVEPCQRGRDPRILIAQPMHELDREGLRQRLPLMPRRERSATDSAGSPPAPSKRSARPSAICLSARLVGDLSREASEILDQNDPQRDRYRPEFADGQRLHLLIGSDEANQHFGVETAIGMGDEGPGDAEHPRIARERPNGELGKLAIVAGRQIRVNLMDLLFHEMIIVDEPFRRGRYRATVIDRLYRGTIGVEQRRPVVGESPRQRLPLGRSRRHDLRDCKAARMVLEALNAEQFFANGVLAIPRRRNARAFKGAPQENFQFDLSAAEWRGEDRWGGNSRTECRLPTPFGTIRSERSGGHSSPVPFSFSLSTRRRAPPQSPPHGQPLDSPCRFGLLPSRHRGRGGNRRSRWSGACSQGSGPRRSTRPTLRVTWLLRALVTRER